MYECNKEIVRSILANLPENKRASLEAACRRNALLTSYFGLDSLTLTVYKEGFLIELEGTRSKFSVFALDDDGDVVILNRKPNESSLHKIYQQWTHADSVIDLYDLLYRPELVGDTSYINVRY